MKGMARGWDSYLQNFPSASSDSGPSTRTSDSDNLETCLQHHDFTDPVASRDTAASSANYFLNPSTNLGTENSGSDCAYQKYYGEVPWQAHGGQIEKHYLSSSGNGDILDFPTPFTPDLQELKQDCELLTAPFEDYSDVSNCSDADVGEARASWKFLSSNSLLKCKTELGTKHQSSEWHFVPPGKPFTTEGLSPKMSDTCTSANVSNPPNMKAEESRIGYPQDHLDGPEKYESCTKGNQPSDSASIVTVTASETQEQPGEELSSCTDNITLEKLMEYSGSVQENVIPTPVTPCNELSLLSIQSFDEHNCLPENVQSECQESKFVSKMHNKFKESGSQNNTFNSSTLMGDICDQNGQCHARNAVTCLESHNSSKSAESPKTLTTNDDESDSKVIDDDQMEERTYTTNSTDPQSGDPIVRRKLLEPDSCLDTSNISEIACTPSYPDQCLSSSKDLEAAPHPSPLVEPDEITTQSPQDEQLSLSKILNCGNDIEGNGIASSLPHQKQLRVEFKKEVQPQRLSEDCAENANVPILFSVKLEPQSCDENVLSPLAQPQSLDQGDFCLQTESMSNEDKNEGANASSISLAIQQTIFDGEGQQESGESKNIQPQSGIEENDKNTNSPCLLDQHPLTQNQRKPQPQSLDPLLQQQPEIPGGDVSNSSPEFDSTKKQPMLYHDPTHPLKSCEKMRKRWQPVVIFNPLTSANARPKQYRCGACQYTTHDVDSLIEHRNNLHVPQSFQFCKVCNLFLVSQNEAENHMCYSTNESPQLSSNPTFGQKEHHVRRRCEDCNISFSRYFQYVKHMRTHTGKTPYKCDGCGCYYAQSSALRRHQTIPNRCKRVKEKSIMSKAITSAPETQQQKDFEQDNTDSHLPKCYVKLVDIYATKMCTSSGTTTSPATVSDKHCNLVEIDPRKDTTTAEHKCPFCPKTFKYSFNRNRHLRHCVRNLVLGGKRKVGSRYGCPLCTSTFASASTRAKHIKMSCLKKFISSLRFKEHSLNTNVCQRKTKEVESRPNLEAEQKPKETMQKSKLREDEQKKRSTPHSTVHHSSKIFRCNECPAIFFHASGKYRHMKKHRLFRLTGKKFSYRKSAIVKESEPESISIKDSECKDNLEPLSQDKDLSLSCQFCEKHFDSSQQLKNHEQIHKDKTAYKCLECGKVCRTSYNLKLHRSTHKKRVQCTVCKKMLPTVEELLKHRHTHTEKGMLQCPDCPLQFQYPVYFLRHLDVHIKKERLCKERSQINPQPSSEAEKEQCVLEVFNCSLCENVFSNAGVLRKHYLTHIPKSNKCPFCNHKFSCRRSLLRHTMRHIGEKPYSCTHCGKQFYSQLHFENHSSVCLLAPAKHVSTLDSNVDKRTGYKCSHCPRILRDKERLACHHKSHEKNSLLPCSCGQYFSSRRLKQHQVNYNHIPLEANCGAPKGPPKSTTTKKPQLKCPHCTKKFMYKSLLLRHLVTHKGDRSYACVHCGHKYTSQATCLQHEVLCERVSNAKGTNVTNDGSASDVSQQTLEEAEQNEADGTSELKCKFCTKTFTNSRSLRYHILSHNEVKPYRCKSCNSCFSRYDYLKVHQTNCNGKRRRLEVCIPKITMDDVGRGWQNRHDILPSEKQKEMHCDGCGSLFANEMFLKTNKECSNCGKIPTETKTGPRIETPTEVAAAPVCYTKNTIKHCINPCFSKKNKYACSYCPRTFGHSWKLTIHKRLHTGERPFACQQCGERFIRKDYIKRHLLKCTKKAEPEKVAAIQDHKSKCPVKPSASHATNCESQQSVSQSPPEGFSCAYCSSRFSLFSQLQEHFVSAHKLETVVPTLPAASLQHHLSNIHIKEEPVEDICDELVRDNKIVNSKSDVALKKEHVCSKCNMTFINKAGLVGHMRAHSTNPPFRCKTCHIGFWNKNFLRNHYRKCNLGLNKVPLKAQLDLALDDSVLVFKDSSTATGSGVLQTSFSCKDDMLEPSAHDPEPRKAESKYQCSECDKSFTDGLLLISHLEDHGREDQQRKLNKCPQCGRLCQNQKNLERHMRAHAINQKFPCPVCSKVFNTLSDLESHSSTHDQSKPHHCALCNQRFWKRAPLYLHYRKDHPSQAFACDLCDSAYLLRSSLQRHYKECHSKELQIFSSGPVMADESDKVESNNEESDSDTAPFFPCHVCGKTFHSSEILEDHQRCHLGEKPHECGECGKCFYQASQLQQHQRMHQSEFQCRICGRGFISAFALRIHKHTQSKNRRYRCFKCDISFAGPWQLREHMNSHGEENSFPCDVCNQVFFSKSSRAEHRKTHSVSDEPAASAPEVEKSSLSEGSSESIKELKYRCGVCNERFKDPEHLSEHGCRAATERPYVCSDCNKHFLHSSHLKKHRNTHHPSWENTECPCNLCKTSFSSPQHYLSHIKTHMANPAQSKHYADSESKKSSNFKCPVCNEHFFSLINLISHFPMHLDIIFECKICKMTFPSGSKLEEHKQSHCTPTMEFECPECRQKILGREAFQKHHCSLQKHVDVKSDNMEVSTEKPTSPFHKVEEQEGIDVTGDDQYNCPCCSRQFSSKSELLKHQNKEHQTNKSFRCETCGKSFALRQYLRKHERRHHYSVPQTAKVPVKSFACSLCQIKFTSLEEFSLHMRLHTEKQPGQYRCDMCYRSFEQLASLKRHQESHVGEVVYECTECDKAFAFPHLLEEHQQTHASSSQ